MHRLTRWASTLYPRWWRERYGEEFAALLEDARPGVGGVFDIAKGAVAMQLTTWTGRRMVMLGAVLGLMAAWGALLSRPRLYSSVATITVAGADPRSATNAMDALLPRALNRATLSNLVRDLDLYPEERRRMPPGDILTRNLRLSLGSSQNGSNQFNIEFRYSDPLLTKAVTTRLASAFINANVQRGGVTVLAIGSSVSDSRKLQPAGWLKVGAAGTAGGTILGALIALLLRRKRAT